MPMGIAIFEFDIATEALYESHGMVQRYFSWTAQHYYSQVLAFTICAKHRPSFFVKANICKITMARCRTKPKWYHCSLRGKDTPVSFPLFYKPDTFCELPLCYMFTISLLKGVYYKRKEFFSVRPLFKWDARTSLKSCL